MAVDEKLQKILNRRNFTNFWECLDYLKHASYTELEALKISLDIFKGNIWGEVINVAQAKASDREMMFASGSTYTSNMVGDWGEISSSGGGVLKTTADGDIFFSNVCEDDLIIDIYVMNDNSNKNHKELYRAYIETKKYKEIPEFDLCYKKITIHLETHLAIHLFKTGFAQYQ